MNHDFLDLSALSKESARIIIDEAHARKAARHGFAKAQVDADAPLAGHMLAMIFDMPSTRTRLSFDLAMRQLGGQTMMINQSESQLGRGESIADTARVISRFSDVVMIRTGSHKNIEDFSTQAAVPVINGLTSFSHPCQIMADVQTFEEHKGPVKGKKIAWFGDGNNVAVSFIHAAVLFDFHLVLAVPEAFMVPEHVLAWARAQGGQIDITQDASAAADGASALVTDCWVSMADDPETSAARMAAFAAYRVTSDLMQKGDDPIFMHCLPAYRGKEVSEDVIDGVNSVIFDEAENRLHAQKAILTYCLGKSHGA